MTPRPNPSAEPSGPGAAKPLRADARRNQARVLDAAEAVFAAKGTAASTEEIARQAGVGIGTVFRHFPTKQALLEAVFAGRLQRLALVDALAAAGLDVIKQATASPVGQELLGAVGTLLTRAQRAGTVRDDIGIAELIALLVGTSRAVEQASWDPDVQARILAVIVDGLRPPTPLTRGHPSSHPSPAS